MAAAPVDVRIAHPRLVPIGRAHAHEGRAQGARLRDRVGRPARRQGRRHPDLQHVRRGLAGIGRDRRQLLLAPPGQRPAGRRGQIGRWPGDAVRGVRLCLRPHRRRHRRERRRRAAPDLQLRPGRQRRPGADRRRRAPRGRLLPREAPGGVYYLVDGKGFVAAEISKADGATARRACARPLPREAPVARPPARRRDRRAARPDGRARGGAPARRAVLRRSGQGRGARRPDVALVAGRGRHVPVRLRSAERRQPVPTDRHAGGRLVAAKLPAQGLGLEPRPRGRVGRRRRRQPSARRSSSASCHWRRR